MRSKDVEFITKSPYSMHAKINGLISRGVTFLNPGSVCIGPDVEIAPGTIIWPGVVLLGSTTIGEDCEIEEGVRIEDSRVGNGTEIHTGSRISCSQIGKRCVIWGARMYHAILKDEVTVHSPNRIVWSIIGKGCDIDSYCLIKYAYIASQCRIGPHATIVGEKLEYEVLLSDKRTVWIGRECQIGTDAYIHERATIKSGAIIARCEDCRIFAEKY